MTTQKKPRTRKQITTINVACCPRCNQDLDVEETFVSGESFKFFRCNKTEGCNYQHPYYEINPK